MPCYVQSLIEGKVSPSGNLLDNSSVNQPGVVTATTRSVQNSNPTQIGGSGSAVTSANNTAPSYSLLERSVISMRNVDCLSEVRSFCGVGQPGFISKLDSAYDSYLKGIIGTKPLRMLGMALDYQDTGSSPKDKVIRLICVNVNAWFKYLSALLEEVLSVVPTLFDKIDKLVTKAMRLLLELSGLLKNCLLSVLINLKQLATNLIMGLLDLNSLRAAMNQCPCILRMIAKLFGCENATTADQVIACIEDKFMDIVGPVLRTMEKGFKFIVKIIEGVFDAIDAAIRKISETIFVTIRFLMKKYCKFLSTKIPVDPIVKVAKALYMDCLLVYTQEKKNGVSYYGMNVYDIMNTFNLWSDCVSGVCDLLGPTVRLEMQRYTDKLRLHIDFWDNPMTADLFTACSTALSDSDADKLSSRLRQIWGNGKPGKDVVDSFKDAIKKAKDGFVEATKKYTDKDDSVYYGASAGLLSPEGGSGDGEPNNSQQRTCFDELMISSGDSKIEAIKNARGPNSIGSTSDHVVLRSFPNNNHKLYDFASVYRDYKIATYCKKVTCDMSNSIGPPVGSSVSFVCVPSNITDDGANIDSEFSDKYIIAAKEIIYSTFDSNNYGKPVPSSAVFTTTFQLMSDNFDSPGITNVADVIKIVGGMS